MHLNPLVSGTKCVVPIQALKFFHKVIGADGIAADGITFDHLSEGNQKLIITWQGSDFICYNCIYIQNSIISTLLNMILPSSHEHTGSNRI